MDSATFIKEITNTYKVCEGAKKLYEEIVESDVEVDWDQVADAHIKECNRCDKLGVPSIRDFEMCIITMDQLLAQNEEFNKLWKKAHEERSDPQEPPPMLPAWLSIIGDRELDHMVTCQFGMAEEVISLMVFKDGSFEVGQGESLRPYLRSYTGNNEQEAKVAFESMLMESLG